MSVIEELKSVLPTKVARWTVVLIWPLLLLAFHTPEFLKPLLWSKSTEKDIALYQILAILLVLLIAAFVISLSVWHYHAFGKGKQKKQISKLYLEALKNRGSNKTLP